MFNLQCDWANRPPWRQRSLIVLINSIFNMIYLTYYAPWHAISWYELWLVNQSICHFHPLFNYAFSHPKFARVEAGHFPLFGPRTYICNFMKRHYTFSCQEKCNCGYEKYHWGWGDTFSCKGPFCMGVDSKWVSSGMPWSFKTFHLQTSNQV